MTPIDVDNAKVVLRALKAETRKRDRNRAVTDFRRGIENKRKAVHLLSSIKTPFTPASISIDAPFMIWALRTTTKDVEGTNIIQDSHIEKGNSWAKIRSEAKADDSRFWVQDDLNFYFLWENFTGQDAVVNVSSYLMLNGGVTVGAMPGWGWTLGFPISTSRATLNAELSLLEWWNNPPTEPVREPGQERFIVQFSKEGQSVFRGIWGGLQLVDEPQPVSGNYHVNYDMFYVPADGTVVFEVGLRLLYDGFDGYAGAGDPDPFEIVCPFLLLDVLTTAQSDLTSLGTTPTSASDP